MAKRRRRRVPEVLWRFFQNRAHTLADTILSLLPSPPPAPAECHCKGRRCLGCSGEDAFSFLVRSKDATDYRKLLNQCFVVVPENAPPFPGFDPHHRWSQLEIVRRSIEMTMLEQSTTLNVIYSGYNKSSRLSAIVELLTSSAWSLLLRRVGDTLMVYLLRNTLIFLPLPQRNHHQVAGFPISELCPRFSGHLHLSSVEHKHPAEPLFGFGRKRKRIDEVDRMPDKLQRLSSSVVNLSSSSVSSFITSSSRCHDATCYGKSSSAEISQACTVDCLETKVHPFVQREKTSSQLSTLPRKHKRENSWQRRRKQRKLSFEAISSLIPCAKSLNEKQYLYRELRSGLSGSDLFHEKTKCSCCLALQTMPTVIAKAQIDRQTMFYKVDKSSTVFPRHHVLNSLKPNSSGTSALFKNIFGSSDAFSTAQSRSCFHHEQCSLIKSTCLYHALIKLLKALIWKAKSCQHLRLLDKHCVISSLDQETDASAGLLTEEGKSERNIEGKEYAEVPVHCDGPVEKFQRSGSSSCRKIPAAWDHQFDPSKSYCPKKQVVSFIWAACRSIVPQELLGSPHNWRALRKNVSQFICLRRFEKFSLKQCIHKVKVTEFALLSNRKPCSFRWSKASTSPKRHQSSKYKESCRISATNSVKHKILQNWIFWFFSHLVVPLLQANFYITESEHGNQEVYYYKKSIWEKLISETFTSLKDQSYLQLNESSLRKIIGTRSFGFSRIRLRPRENGFRVLANLKASSRIPVKSSLRLGPSASSKLSNPRNVKYAYFKPVNKLLYDMHAVLKGIQVKEPDMLGSSVFDYNDVYKKFVPFISLLKSGSASLPGVFVVVADVSKAFDSVDQDKLLSIMKEVISDDEYPLNKYLQVVCGRRSTWVRNHLMVPLQDNIPGSLKGSSSRPICAPHSILVKQESSKNIKKEEIFLNLNEHIKRNVLRLGNGFFLQKVGIPQGSILSSLLCSFYYGHLERNMIYPFLDKVCDTAAPGDFSGIYNSYGTSISGMISDNKPVICTSKYLLLRFIDDFLFVSTSRNQASLFHSLLQGGFHEYNCYMNKGKFGLNFGRDHSRSNRFYVGEDGISFLRWSGLLFNCSTLEIQADYMRYLNSHLSSCLTVNRNDHPARFLMTKLCDYLRPKCHPLFYDSNINSAGVVRLNIYQVFLLCAMKFHCYVSSLNGISTFSKDFYMDAVEKSLRFMHNLIKKRMNSLRLGSCSRPIFEVRKSEIEWLGLTAYSRVLKRKYARYVELLLLLRSKLMAHGESKSTSSALEYAVDDIHSSLIWKIKY